MVFITLPLQAKKVALERAEKVAQHYVESKCGLHGKPANVQLKHTVTQRHGMQRSFSPPSIQDTVFYYVFNVGETGGGFVIVSGDDAVTPILGYSNNGNYDENNLPPNFAYWMNYLQQQIAYAKTQNLPQSDVVKADWEAYLNGTISYATNTKEPLIQTKWDQEYPYNDLCPRVSEIPTFTGCAATAMAQIMFYHRHPVTGIGSRSYTWNNQTLSADFGATTYQWNNMPSSLTAGSTPEQKNAVATLMYHCGVAVEMNYTPSVSLANSYSFKYALPTYFKYDGGIDLKQRSEYFGNDAGWHDLLKNELDAGRPIFYAGASSTGGHAFVCDGYDDGGCFHFNWGWSGSGDGWYVTSNLVNGYNNSQEIVLNIKPALPITVPINDQCVGATSLHCGANLTGQTTVGSTAKTEIVATNASPYGVWYSFVGDGQQTTITSIASAGFNHSMGIYSGSCGSLTHIITKDNSGPGGTETHTFNTTSGTTYYVYIAHYSTSGNSTQTGTFSISRICIPPEQASLQFLSLEVSEPLYQNMPGSFTATLKNNGTVAYNSRLWIHL